MTEAKLKITEFKLDRDKPLNEIVGVATITPDGEEIAMSIADMDTFEKHENEALCTLIDKDTHLTIVCRDLPERKHRVVWTQIYQEEF